MIRMKPPKIKYVSYVWTNYGENIPENSPNLNFWEDTLSKLDPKMAKIGKNICFQMFESNFIVENRWIKP